MSTTPNPKPPELPPSAGASGSDRKIWINATVKGYHNNNCVGCVKGGAGYWNKIRVDFPEAFERMARLELEIGAHIIKGKHYLDELPQDAGRWEDEDIECGVLCITPNYENETSP